MRRPNIAGYSRLMSEDEVGTLRAVPLIDCRANERSSSPVHQIRSLIPCGEIKRHFCKPPNLIGLLGIL